MAVIWGLDLREIQWGKFKGSYMFNDVYHLRKTKMIVYQIAMIFCVCSESVGTAALTDYVSQREQLYKRSDGRAIVENHDIVSIFGYNIFIGIAVSTIFGSGFFFDLFWPERHESVAVKWAWRISSVVVSFMAFADALLLTLIVAMHRAHIIGVSAQEEAYWFKAHGKPHPIYRKNGYNVASVVLLWPGVVGSFASTYIMCKSIAHNDIYGPKAAAYRSATKGEEASYYLPSATPLPAPYGSNRFASGESSPETSKIKPYPGT
ncbi:hypothetical protein PZA11_006231 [Diplocarpon coronariae]